VTVLINVPSLEIVVLSVNELVIDLSEDRVLVIVVDTARLSDIGFRSVCILMIDKLTVKYPLIYLSDANILLVIELAVTD
jgi:hypothetical protein